MSIITPIEAPSRGVQEVHVAAGTYYVGDPCYVLPDNIYESLTDLIFPPEDQSNDQSVFVELDTPTGPAVILDWRTIHGDGRFPVYGNDITSPERGLGVDSGGLSIIDTRLITKAIGNSGVKLTITNPIPIIIDENSNLHGGTIIQIDVHEDEENEDLDDNDWDDED